MGKLSRFNKPSSDLSEWCEPSASDENTNSRQVNLIEPDERRPPRAQSPSPDGWWSRTHQRNAQRRINKRFYKALIASDERKPPRAQSPSPDGWWSRTHQRNAQKGINKRFYKALIASDERKPPRAQSPSPDGWWSRTHRRNAQRRINKRFYKALIASDAKKTTGGPLSELNGRRSFSSSHTNESQSSSSGVAIKTEFSEAQPTSEPRVYRSKKHKQNAKRHFRKWQAKQLKEREEQSSSQGLQWDEGQYGLIKIEKKENEVFQ